jgi:hypothetical protein
MSPTHDQVQYAAFLLRIALGAMFLAYSVILKLFVYTPPGTAAFFRLSSFASPIGVSTTQNA